jgi:hypothetical protein
MPPAPPAVFQAQPAAGEIIPSAGSTDLILTLPAVQPAAGTALAVTLAPRRSAG